MSAYEQDAHRPTRASDPGLRRSVMAAERAEQGRQERMHFANRLWPGVQPVPEASSRELVQQRRVARHHVHRDIPGRALAAHRSGWLMIADENHHEITVCVLLE